MTFREDKRGKGAGDSPFRVTSGTKFIAFYAAALPVFKRIEQHFLYPFPFVYDSWAV